MRRLPFALLLFISLVPSAPVVAQARTPLDAAFEAFWSASTTKDADKAAERVVASGAPFAEVLARLTEGRTYGAGVETGEVRWATLPGGGSDHATTVVVPKSYLPTLKYPVRVFLHGGVARPDPGEGEGGGGAGPARPNRARRRLDFKERYIAVYPSGYADAQWWFSNQMTNFQEILDRLKRTYNIDENRVHLMGVSDGGTGTHRGRRLL